MVDTRIPLTRWQRALLDGALAVAAVLPGFLSPDRTDLTAGLIALAGVVLCARRRLPWTTLVTVSALAAIADSRSFTVPLCLATFTVAMRVPMVPAALGYLVAVGTPLLGTIVKIALDLADPTAGGAIPAIGVGTSLVDPYVVVALAAGIVTRNVYERRRVQAALHEERIATARALERARITAEMHDVVGHALTVMISLANGARSAWDTDPERSRRALAHLGDVGATALDDMHRTLRLLRDADRELDDALHESGHELVDIDGAVEVFRAAGVPVHLRWRGDDLPENAMLRAAVHRIVQECLTNVLRHAAGVTTVDVTIECSTRAGTVTIDVEDDGIPNSLSRGGTRRGLIGIAERAAAFGGTCTSGPRSPRGWAVHVALRTESKG